MATVPPSAAEPSARREILIISHSTLFYWWPVWAIGYLMALITFFTGQHLALVPRNATPDDVKHDAEGAITYRKDATTTTTLNLNKRDVIVAPEGQKEGTHRTVVTPLYISSSKNVGVIFCFVLLLVIAITNIPLRGLWSVIVISFIIFLVIILALLDRLEEVLGWIDILDVRINMAGYFLISTVLLILWLVVFFFFDRQIYMVFTPGQLRVKLEIGDAETAYDTAGMTIQKQRSDLFRHWILGLGSGDLIVRTSGAQSHHFDMPNVLFLGRKVQEIEDMLRSRTVVSGHNVI